MPYDLWAAQGFIEATPGNVVDYGAIEQRILADSALFQVKEIAYDPWNATHIALRLQEEGAAMVEFRQGFRSMAAPTRELEKLIVSRKLAHGGNPVTRWMAANVAVAQDPAGNLKPAKDKSTERIDGIVALIMAIGRAMLPPGGAPLGTRGSSSWSPHGAKVLPRHAPAGTVEPHKSRAHRGIVALSWRSRRARPVQGSRSARPRCCLTGSIDPGGHRPNCRQDSRPSSSRRWSRSGPRRTAHVPGTGASRDQSERQLAPRRVRKRWRALGGDQPPGGLMRLARVALHRTCASGPCAWPE